MDEITIRSATRTDERALGRYGGALMRQHHAFDPPRFVLSENPGPSLFNSYEEHSEWAPPGELPAWWTRGGAQEG